MNGYEMVKRIRETDGETPILFSSALISPKDVVKGYEIGANNYIKKPFIPEELDAHVHALLKLSKGEKSKDTSQFETCFGCKQDFDCARDRFVADAL